MEKFPLNWPAGYRKTEPNKRVYSKFKQTPSVAQKSLHEEVSRLGGKNLIVSSNVPVREDGFMYSDVSGQKLREPGVAIYFKYKGRDVAMCCDQYLYVWENVYALSKGIEALRGMDRWGVSDFLERAFTGFVAIEQRHQRKWHEILGVPEKASAEIIEAAWRQKAKEKHPDRGGSHEAFIEARQAYEEGIKSISAR